MSDGVKLGRGQQRRERAQWMETSSDTATRLLQALRDAGCHVFIEEDQLFCSPPSRPVAWDSDVEEALDEWDNELKALVFAERVTVH